jgi:hypothetical protein
MASPLPSPVLRGTTVGVDLAWPPRRREGKGRGSDLGDRFKGGRRELRNLGGVE